MGQRSQIYIRYRNKDGIQLIARYYQWNYGERMISRARGIIEYLNEYMEYFTWFFDDANYMKKLTRICDVNFDMRDIVLSSDILQEVRDEFYEEAMQEGATRWIFGQANNDGQLLIDVANNIIKYAFINYYTEPEKIMDGNGYMEMNVDAMWKTKNWGTLDDNDYAEIKAYTENNIEYISNNAQIMSVDDAKEFITCDYKHLVSK